MHAEESFFATLAKIDTDNLDDISQRLAIQDLSKETTLGKCPRSALWGSPCKGELVNWVCNVAVEDLARLRTMPGCEGCSSECIFGNKFKLTVDAAAVACQMREIFYENGISLESAVKS